MLYVYDWIFQEHEVEKMFTLKSGRLPPADVKNIIFFIRPRLELMDIIAENVLRSVYVSRFQAPPFLTMLQAFLGKTGLFKSLLSRCQAVRGI